MSHKVSSLKSQAQIGKVTDADESQGLGETIEILEAQVESLELEICYEDRASKQLTLTQAEELAKNFLATEKPLKDALVELLTAIYNLPVKLDDLTQRSAGGGSGCCVEQAQTDRFCFTNQCNEIKDVA